MSDIVIKVENLSKEYRLGVISHQTLTQDLQSWWARRWGKEDPNSPLVSHESANSSTGRFWALKDISFEVSQGEVVGIIGRNGAGKSTLLKILSRVTTPSRGEVRLRGRVVSLLEVGTGFHPELTGRENIFLNGAILGMDKEEIRRKFDEIVDFSEIGKFIDTPVKRYSSGMYVRLAFAVAAHLEPEILVVDEILAVGDAAFQKKCLGKMGDVAGQGRTILFVSHNMQAVKNLCGRGILLDQGQIVHDGPVGEVVDVYLLRGQKQKANRDILPEMHRIEPIEFEVYRLEIRNEKGELTDTLLMGEVFTICFFWKVNNPDQSYRIGAVLRSADEIRLATIVNTASGKPHIRGIKDISYYQTVQIKNILMPGKYHLDVNVKSRAGFYVEAIDGISFHVVPLTKGDVSPQGVGVVCLDAEWSEPQCL